MRRRDLLLCALTQDDPWSDARMNKFANLYNQFIGKLRDGILDLKLWGRVCRAWNEIGPCETQR